MAGVRVTSAREKLESGLAVMGIILAGSVAAHHFVSPAWIALASVFAIAGIWYAFSSPVLVACISTMGAWITATTIYGILVTYTTIPIMVTAMALMWIIFAKSNLTVTRGGSWEEIDLDGVREVGRKLRPNRHTTTRRIALGTHSYEDVTRRESRIEAIRRLPRGAVRVEPDEANAGRAWMHVTRRDPHRRPQVWPGTRATSIADPIALGPRPDGSLATFALFGDGGARDCLIAGVRGSGKSNLIQLSIVATAGLPDAAHRLIDLKGGQELREWRPDAIDPHQGWNVLREVSQEVDRRSRQLTDRVIAPSPDLPVVVVVVDEIANLFRSVQEADPDLLARIIGTGRAVGVSIVAATQHPVAHSMGGTSVTTQFRNRFLFRMEREYARELVLAGDQDPTSIPQDRPGTCFMTGPNVEREEMPIRAYYIPDETIREKSHLLRSAPVREEKQEKNAPLNGDKKEPFFDNRDF